MATVGGLRVPAVLAALVALSACAPAAPPAPLEVTGPGCPSVQIVPGRQAHVVYERAGQTSAGSVRYQASILYVDGACFRAGETLTATVEASGRIAAGPRASGAAGTAPLVIALSTTAGQVIETHTFTISASLAAPTYGGDWAITDTFAIPPSVRGQRLVVEFGFAQ